MSQAASIPLTQRVVLSVKVMAWPSRANLDSVAFASERQWANSLVIYTVGVALIVAFASALPGGSIEVTSLISIPITLGVLALAWSAVAQLATRYVLGNNTNVFDPLLYLSASSFLILLFASFIFGFLPSSAIIISTLPIIYSQVLVILLIAQVCRTTIVKAALIAVIAALLGVILTIIAMRFIATMPGFLEHEYLA